MKTLSHASLCSIVQVSAIVGGVLLTAKVHRMLRTLYGNEGWYIDHTRFSVWLRDFGAWLLLVPVIYIVTVACIHSRRHEKKIQTSGIVLTILVCVVAAFGIIQAFRTPLIQSIQK